MDKPETMYSLFTEMISLKKQAAACKKFKENQHKKKLVEKYNEQLVDFAELIKIMVQYLENINQKHTAAIAKMQDKSLVSSDNSVQVSHSLHQDFINIMQSKNKLEHILQGDLISGEDSSEDLVSVVEEIKNVHTSIRNQYIERLYEFKTAKGLLENIVSLKQVDAEHEQTIEEKSEDSDLGCFPHENETPNNIPTVIVHFATSSPINNK